MNKASDPGSGTVTLSGKVDRITALSSNVKWYGKQSLASSAVYAIEAVSLDGHQRRTLVDFGKELRAFDWSARL